MAIVKMEKKETQQDWVVVIGTTSGWQEINIPIISGNEQEETEGDAR